MLDNPDRIALFLDLDGTLLDIAGAPTEVTTPPSLVPALGRVGAALDGAMAILTGRTIADVDRLLAPLRLAAAGVHGNEFRSDPDGPVEVTSDTVPAPVVEAVRRIVAATPGLLLEQKDISIAVHYRGAPDAQSALEGELHDVLARGDSGLVLSHGRRVFELVPRGATKGTALQRLMRRPRFAGRIPVVVGDDMPDETALAAAAELGGVGLKVAGEHFASGATHFGGPGEVRRWLDELAERFGR
jgi:trehalose 6-phosphate phosphatase